jgi:hypothetical protein
VFSIFSVSVRSFIQYFVKRSDQLLRQEHRDVVAEFTSIPLTAFSIREIKLERSRAPLLLQSFIRLRSPLAAL